MWAFAKRVFLARSVVSVADFFPESLSRFEAKNDAADLELLRKIAQVLAEEKLDIAKLERLIDLSAFVKFWAMEKSYRFLGWILQQPDGGSEDDD